MDHNWIFINPVYQALCEELGVKSDRCFSAEVPMVSQFAIQAPVHFCSACSAHTLVTGSCTSAEQLSALQEPAVTH